MRDIVLCFLQKTAPYLFVKKTKQGKTPIKNLRRKKIDCPASVFLAKTFFKLLRLIVIAFRKRMRTYFSAKQ